MLPSLLLFALLVPAAADQVGTVLSLVGEAQVRRDGADRSEPAKPGTRLHSNDVLLTGSDGLVQVRLADGSRFTLEAKAVVRLVQHSVRSQQTELELSAGRVRCETVALIQPDSKFEIRTNNGNIGVVGGGPADFIVDVSSPVSTRVKVTTGELSAADSDSHRVRLTAGQSALLPPGTDAAPTVEPRVPDLPNGVYHVGRGVSAPRLIYRVEPEYSQAARKVKRQGTVAFYGVVEATGGIRDLRVTRSLDPELDANAMEAVKKWRFSPGLKEGQPVDVVIQIVVTFRPI